MQDIRKEFGYIIKKNRKLHRYTQAELANLVSVDPKYISRIETGASYPSLSVVEKIFNELNIAFGSLFERNSANNKNVLIENISENLKNLQVTELQALDTLVNSFSKSKSH